MPKILFNENYCLQTAVFEGYKTHTRRVVKRQIPEPILQRCLAGQELYVWSYAPYKKNGLVKIAQSYQDIFFELKSKSILNFSDADTFYKKYHNEEGWSNKLYVKADAMIHSIFMLHARMEYLQDITDDGCIKEGIRFDEGSNRYYFTKRSFDKYGNAVFTNFFFDSPRTAFASFVNAAYQKGLWEQNPLVFDFEFRFHQ